MTGAIQSLCVTTDRRMSFDPDMPTVAETVPGFEAFSWNGLVARSGTPPTIIEKVRRDFSRAVQQPEVVKLLTGIVMEPIGSSPGEFLELIKADQARWERVVRELKLATDQK